MYCRCRQQISVTGVFFFQILNFSKFSKNTRSELAESKYKTHNHKGPPHKTMTRLVHTPLRIHTISFPSSERLSQTTATERSCGVRVDTKGKLIRFSTNHGKA